MQRKLRRQRRRRLKGKRRRRQKKRIYRSGAEVGISERSLVRRE
jgi:hypothetical protein